MKLPFKRLLAALLAALTLLALAGCGGSGKTDAAPKDYTQILHDARSDEQVQQINHRFLPPKQHTLREEDKKRLIDDGIARNRIPCCTFVYESHFLRKYQSMGHRRDC